MANRTCPQCSSKRFYVKDPDSAFETYEFEVVGDQIQFSEGIQPSDVPSIDDETMMFCDRCAWHDRLKTLK